MTIWRDGTQAGALGQQAARPGAGRDDDAVGPVVAATRGSDTAVEVEGLDRRAGPQHDIGAIAKMAGEVRNDVLGKQDAAGVDPEGALDAGDVEQGKAPVQDRRREFRHRPADAVEHGRRACRPGVAAARQRQRAGGGIVALAEVAATAASQAA